MTEKTDSGGACWAVRAALPTGGGTASPPLSGAGVCVPGAEKRVSARGLPVGRICPHCSACILSVVGFGVRAECEGGGPALMGCLVG